METKMRWSFLLMVGFMLIAAGHAVAIQLQTASWTNINKRPPIYR